MVRPHVLLVTFPAQGHINPSLTFAKTLLKNNIDVTFATSLYAQRRIAKSGENINDGITFVAFSDGYEDGFKLNIDQKHYMTEIRNRGSQAVRDTILTSAEQGRPVTRLVYTLLLPWAVTVARELHIPSALLWIQPATVLGVYYYYFHGYGEEVDHCLNDPNWEIQLPKLPLMAKRDLPSFMLPSSKGGPYSFDVLPTFKELIETLDEEDNPRVLVNTFDELEFDALKAIDHYELIAIGPLIPLAFLDGKDPTDKAIGGDLFKKSDDYVEWLNSKQQSSVIYVSFGSLLMLPKPQMEEIAKGLLDCGRPFLWVVRVNDNLEEDDDNKLGCLKELEKLGKIVPWCSQLEVLMHPSLGCFVTHCGWNSTLESIACGVPLVAFPQWTDQGTNAKLIEDVWRTGVRVSPREDGMVESDDIKRCIETVMDNGEKSREFRENAKKWKDLAREALKEGGSSTNNLKAFVEQLGGC